MKIRYTGTSEIGIIDFVTYGIIKPGEVIVPNKIYEVPDNVPEYLVKAIEIAGDFEVMNVKNPVADTIKNVKKENKDKKKEKEE